MKYRVRFVAKNNPENRGYFVRKLKVGFRSCSTLYPEMAKVMTKAKFEEVMHFLREQGEFDYYDFTVEEVNADCIHEK